MELDEPLAYALTTWAHFDAVITDTLLRAMCGAFAIIAVADGDVTEEETARFLSVIRERSEAFPKLDMALIEQQFRGLCAALLTDPEGGRQHALSEIEQVKGLPAQQEFVQSTAQIALVADQHVKRNEELVMAEICDALGIDGKIPATA
jgi:tellurite resistance protein TerB